MTAINLKRYPIDTPNSPALLKAVEQARAQLAISGCAILKSFLTPEGVRKLAQEADAVANKGHWSFSETNAYFTKDDPTLPADHPARKFCKRSNAFIPADNFTPTGTLRKIYDYKGFDGFIQTCLQERKFYRYADPLADVIVNMAEEGNGFPWHFDTNNFTVTLAIQNAISGGEFEYAANIREKSENFEDVAKVLAGNSDRVTSITLEPGDLQLFRGRNSLHRVAPLRGSTPRYVAIFSYVEEPGMVATPERCMQLYGRVLPIHYEKAGVRADTYLD